MAVQPAVLIQSKYAENAQTTQYTSSDVRTAIDKFTVTNVSSAVATIAVNLVPSGGSALASNQIVKTRSVGVGESYTCPELVGHWLAPGDFISTLAGTASALVIRASGRSVT